MAGGIYLIQDNGQLVEMTERYYDSESLLQKLLAEYPSLLAGDQIPPEAPRRWLLVGREASLPAEEGGPARWSVDHLFFDQDAVPTIVECKRSGDTRIRREVVGQMLDYAANAVLYWPIERLRGMFEAACQAKGLQPDVVLDALNPGGDPEEFWQKAASNLQGGRVRLLFVADEIPSELRRVVEFLNQQMSPAEVLAIEIKQYVGESLKTLVPRVVGQTALSERKSSSGGGGRRQWDESSFMQTLEAKRGPAEANAARTILEWAKANTPVVWYGQGKVDGSLSPRIEHNGQTHWLFTLWTYGRIEILFEYMKAQQPFNAADWRRELVERLNKIPGVALPNQDVPKRPSFPLQALTDGSAMREFISTLDWAVGVIKGQAGVRGTAEQGNLG